MLMYFLVCISFLRFTFLSSCHFLFLRSFSQSRLRSTCYELFLGAHACVIESRYQAAINSAVSGNNSCSDTVQFWYDTVCSAIETFWLPDNFKMAVASREWKSFFFTFVIISTIFKRHNNEPGDRWWYTVKEILHRLPHILGKYEKSNKTKNSGSRFSFLTFEKIANVDTPLLSRICQLLRRGIEDSSGSQRF